MHEVPPIEVIDVAFRTGAHEAGGDHGSPIEPALVVERLPVNEPPRTETVLTSTLVLDDEPFGNPPGPDAACRLARIAGIRRWREQARRCHAGHARQLLREPRLCDFLEVGWPRPCIEAADDGRM